MGSWGSGNFDNDSALDMSVSALEPVVAEIQAFCSSDRVVVEDVDAVMACVEIHLALLRQCRAPRPMSKIAKALQSKVLRLFDEQIDQLKPTAEHKVNRRAVLSTVLESYVAEVRADG